MPSVTRCCHRGIRNRHLQRSRRLRGCRPARPRYKPLGGRWGRRTRVDTRWLSGDGRSCGPAPALRIPVDILRRVLRRQNCRRRRQLLGRRVGAGFSSVGPDGTGGLPVVTGLPHRAITQILTPLGVSIRWPSRFPRNPGRAEPTTLPSWVPELYPSLGASSGLMRQRKRNLHLANKGRRRSAWRSPTRRTTLPD